MFPQIINTPFLFSFRIRTTFVSYQVILQPT